MSRMAVEEERIKDLRKEINNYLVTFSGVIRNKIKECHLKIATIILLLH